MEVRSGTGSFQESDRHGQLLAFEAVQVVGSFHRRLAQALAADFGSTDNGLGRKVDEAADEFIWMLGVQSKRFEDRLF